jgi:release factor glutamine methyltransferase
LGPDPIVVDLGTGSGAIALSIAAEAKPGAVWATDASAEALAIARANLVGLGGSRAAKVRLEVGSWWDALPTDLRGRVSLVVSNPPYVTTAEMATLPAVVGEWEPTAALEAGPRGLEAIEVVVAGAADWLRRPGAVVVELAPHQAAAAEAIAHRAGFDETRVEKDLAGRERALVARLHGG